MAIDSQDTIEFFESKVRPLLVEACGACHGEEKQKAGLRLDTPSGIRRGSDFQPSIIPGDPDQSPLIQAIERRNPDLEMPPDDPLNADQIAILRQWIAHGAVLPDVSDQSPRKPVSQHWAFQPILRPKIPSVSHSDWPRNPIDHFILARLEEEGIPSAPRAQSHAFLRRLYDNVIGLPPTPEEIAAFGEAPRDSRVHRVVDQLLAHPGYGERWGRHWLDVARYADTKGPLDGGQTTYAFAYTYRDWVIRALNQDLGYDDFLRFQLAADLLGTEGRDHLAGLGFLTVGHRFYDRIDEIMDDRIDVVSRGLVGLTVGCARCHDHKYDPIPTKDYYAMYGVFRSTIEPYNYEKPILGPAGQASGEDYHETYQRLKAPLVAYRQDRHRSIAHEMRAFAADYLAYVAWENPTHRSRSQFLRKTERTLLRAGSLHGEGAAIKWKRFVESRSDEDPVFGIWHRLAALTPEQLSEQAATLVQDRKINALVRRALLDAPPKTLEGVGRQIGAALEKVYQLTQVKGGKAPVPLSDPAQEELRLVLFGDDSPCVMTERESRTCYHILESDKLYRLERAFEGHLINESMFSDPRAMVLKEKTRPFRPYVFVRGDPMRVGQSVDRGFLELFEAQTEQGAFQSGSGRSALAEAIVHPSNPLTARVIVNRVWAWHFGRGLVGTQSDFGTRSDPPSHPRLLDYMAAELIDHQWSLKHLHRLILTSQTYAQSSVNLAAQTQDPDNRLWGRMNRRRLSFESLRDGVLAVSGQLSSVQGGFPDRDFSSSRRSVYLLVNRNRLDHRASFFDFPDPGLSSPGRSTSIMPQQSLFLMNDTLMASASSQLAEVLERRHGSVRQKINWVYQQVFGREPGPEEESEAAEFLNRERTRAAFIEYPGPPIKRWDYGYGVFDPSLNRLTRFRSLPFWSGRDWRASRRSPDPEFGFLRLTQRGGHPARGAAVVRRFIVPMTGPYSITGHVEHDLDDGDEPPSDGVRATILVNGGQGVHQVKVRGQERETKALIQTLEAGSTIDFVVDALGTDAGDWFTWTVEIECEATSLSADQSKSGERYESKEAFSGPPQRFEPLSPLAKLVHALFQSNEFLFLD